MFRRSLLKGVAAGSAATVLSSGTAHAQTPLRIRIQTAVPSASIYFELLKRMGDRIDKMSAGRVKMEMLPDGAVVAGVRNSRRRRQRRRRRRLRVDALLVGQERGGGPLLQSDGGRRRGPRPALARRMDLRGRRLRPLPQALQGRAEGQRRAALRPTDGTGSARLVQAPITSTEDFKKMKYRAPPGITGEIFKEMGVSAVALPGGEIVTSAQRGVIDAAEWIGPADDLNLGLQTVWKHYYLQGLHQSTDIGEILINKTVWDKLSPDLQEIIRTAAMASMMETYTYNVYRNAQAIVRLRNEFKVEIHDTPKDFFPQFVRATNVVLDRYGQKDVFFKQVLDSQRNFAKTVVPYWTKILDLYANLGNAALAAPPPK